MNANDKPEINTSLVEEPVGNKDPEVNTQPEQVPFYVIPVPGGTQVNKGFFQILYDLYFGIKRKLVMRSRPGALNGSDNVFELFNLEEAKNNRFNFIFIGRSGTQPGDGTLVKNNYTELAATRITTLAAHPSNGSIVLNVFTDGDRVEDTINNDFVFFGSDSRNLPAPYAGTDGLSAVVAGQKDGIAALAVHDPSVPGTAISFYVKKISTVGNGYPAVAGDTLIPEADNVYDLGTNTFRWRLIRGVTITPGDLKFENDWVITENDKVGIKEPGLTFTNPEGKILMVLTDKGLYADVKPLSDILK